MMPDRDAEAQVTYDKDVIFITNLENAMGNARQLLGALQRDWFSLDRRTRHETISRIHALIAVDLYARFQALAEYRAQKENFEYDIALVVHEAGELNVSDREYYSKIRDLYLRMLARYQYWMDELGILLQTEFHKNFASSLIDAMRDEYKVAKLKDKIRGMPDGR